MGQKIGHHLWMAPATGRGRVAGVERLVQTSYVSNLMTTVES